MSKIFPVRFVALVGAALIALSGCAAAPEPGRRPTASDVLRPDGHQLGRAARPLVQRVELGGPAGGREEVLASTRRCSSRPARPTSPRTSSRPSASGCGFILTVGYELAAAPPRRRRRPTRRRALRDRRRDGRCPEHQADRLRHRAGRLPRRLPGRRRQQDRQGRDLRRRQPAARDPVHGRLRRRRREVQRGARHERSRRSAGPRRPRTASSPATSKTPPRASDVDPEPASTRARTSSFPSPGQVGEGAAAAALAAGNVSLIWVDNDGYDTLPAKYRGILLTSVLKNTAGGRRRDRRSRARTARSATRPFVGTLENGGVGIARLPRHGRQGQFTAGCRSRADCRPTSSRARS